MPTTNKARTNMPAWHYAPAEDLDKKLVERLRCFPREPDMFVYGVRSLAALALRGWLRAYHRFEIVGREHLPREGSFVMVANHASHLDTACLLAALPLRRLHRAFPAAAQDYFFVTIPRLAVAAVFVNALPFDREVHVRQSLRLCQELLANSGNILVIFPEGSRSLTGEIGEFKPGTGLLLAGTDVPVLPCHLTGAFRALPKGACVPRPSKLKLAIGAPRRYASMPATREAIEQIADELRAAVAELGETQ
jgi:1-acyl-sn-glycerol-3-phosphate acyltransferase